MSNTLLNILTAASDTIRPLIDFFSDQVREDRVIGTDDTGVKRIIPPALPMIEPGDLRSQRIHDVVEEAMDTDCRRHRNRATLSGLGKRV